MTKPPRHGFVLPLVFIAGSIIIFAVTSGRENGPIVEKTSLLFLSYGGFILAFALLIFATLAHPRPRVIITSVLGAFCGLFYEGGCNAVASGFAKATGGGAGNDRRMESIIWSSFIIAVIWSLILFARLADEEPQKPDDQKKDGGA